LTVVFDKVILGEMGKLHDGLSSPPFFLIATLAAGGFWSCGQVMLSGDVGPYQDSLDAMDLFESEANDFQEAMDQLEVIPWARTIGGEGNDMLQSLTLLQDGGYLMVGTSYSFGSGNADMWFVFLSERGQISNQLTFDNGVDDYGTCAAQSSDGSILFIGSTSVSEIEGPGILLSKLDHSGEVSWQRFLHETSSGFPRNKPLAVHSVPGEGYMIAASSGYPIAVPGNLILLGVNEHGDILWLKTTGNVDDENLSLERLTDGNFLLCGMTMRSGMQNSCLILDSQASNIRHVNITDPYFSMKSSKATNDEGFIACGAKGSDGHNILYIVKFDTNLNVQWQKKYSADIELMPLAIEQLQGSGYAVIGEHLSDDGVHAKAWIMILSETGDFRLGKIYGGHGWDQPRTLDITDDQGLIMSGHTDSFGLGLSDFWVMKMNLNAEINGHCPEDFSSSFTAEASEEHSEIQITDVDAEQIEMESYDISGTLRESAGTEFDICNP
jgi:hypothetical protein